MMFKAKETDARLGRFAWMPQALIDGAAQGDYQPVANGFLTWKPLGARCWRGLSGSTSHGQTRDAADLVDEAGLRSSIETSVGCYAPSHFGMAR